MSEGKGSSREGAKIVACIPAYNEEETIGEVVSCARRYVDVVLVCDDGSTDRTAERAEMAGAIVLRHPRNRGYGAALRTLLTAALEYDPDVVVTLDADGQHDPADIPSIAAPIIEGRADVVIGSRFLSSDSRKEVPRYRELGIRVITKVASGISGLDISDSQSGFRAFSKRAVRSIKIMDDGMGATLEVIQQAAALGLRVEEVPVVIRYRGLETSTYNPIRQGLGLLLKLADLIGWRRPLVSFGVPAAASLIVSMVFTVKLLRIFNLTRYFSVPLALLSTAFGIVSAILFSTGVTIYAVKKAVREEMKMRLASHR